MPGLFNRRHALHRLHFTLWQADTDLLEAFLGIAYALFGAWVLLPMTHTWTVPAFAPLAVTGLPEWVLGLVMLTVGSVTVSAVGNGWRLARSGGQAVVCVVALFLATMFLQGSPWGTGWVVFAVFAGASFVNVLRLARTHRR